MKASKRGDREIQGAETLLGADEVARIRSYCGMIESQMDGTRYARYSGEGYNPGIGIMCARSRYRGGGGLRFSIS
jgi:hypothetical protein